MKKFLKKIANEYKFATEYSHQVAYVGFIISTILVLFTTQTFTNFIIYTSMLALHLITLAFFCCMITDGYMEDNIAVLSFILSNIAIIIISSILTVSLIPLIIYIGLILLGRVYIHYSTYLTATFLTEKRPKLEVLFKKHRKLFCLILLAIPTIAIIIPIIFTPWNIFAKVGIVLAYIISIPFIANAANNGLFDIEEMLIL